MITYKPRLEWRSELPRFGSSTKIIRRVCDILFHRKAAWKESVEEIMNIVWSANDKQGLPYYILYLERKSLQQLEPSNDWTSSRKFVNMGAIRAVSDQKLF